MSGFSAILMDHFESPRNMGRIEASELIGEADFAGRLRMTLSLVVETGTVRQARFQSQGCGVSIACGSMLTEMIIGRTVGECLAVTPQQLDAALDGLPVHKQFVAGVAIDALRKALAPVRTTPVGSH